MSNGQGQIKTQTTRPSETRSVDGIRAPLPPKPPKK